MSKDTDNDAPPPEQTREQGGSEFEDLGSDVDPDIDEEEVEENDLLGGLDIETTDEIDIPDRLVDQVIGQDHARDVVQNAA
jgi:Lon-like ATP-dependent protease